MRGSGHRLREHESAQQEEHNDASCDWLTSAEMTTKPFEGEAESISIQAGRHWGHSISYCRSFLLLLVLLVLFYFANSSFPFCCFDLKKKCPNRKNLKGKGLYSADKSRPWFIARGKGKARTWSTQPQAVKSRKRTNAGVCIVLSSLPPLTQARIPKLRNGAT